MSAASHAAVRVTDPEELPTGPGSKEVTDAATQFLNPFPVCPENTRRQQLRLQHLPQDNSGITVLTSSQSLPRNISPLLLFSRRSSLPIVFENK